MTTITFPYGKNHITHDFDTPCAVLTSQLHTLEAAENQTLTVREALENPIGSPRLSELVKDKSRVLVITSDHTRPVPSKVTLPVLLSEIRLGNPSADIHILVATGVHRSTTVAELRDKFGDEIALRETILVHDAFDDSKLSSKGTLPSGCKLSVDSEVDWADIVVSEGFIEPHFFAGFSGGRKSILPGIASAKSVMSNHCYRLIDDPRARTGVLEGNPIHADMCAAAKLAGLAFILNVIIDADKRVVRAFAGDPFKAHEAGCAFSLEKCRVPHTPGDIVITTNGGYPLDQNVYQAVKSMTAAEGCVREGGVIICMAASADGSGGEGFHRWFADVGGNPQAVLDRAAPIAAEDTLPDQWQAQILARVMLKARVIMVTEPIARDTVEGMGMHWCADLDAALSLAYTLTAGREIVAIPDGVSVIVE